MPHDDALEPNRALTRHQLENLAWTRTPGERRSASGSRREVLLTTTEGATLVPLNTLTDFQLRKYIGHTTLEEAGDMRKNARATIYWKGDLAEYTGETKPLHGGLFYEIKLLEGHLKGESKWTQVAPKGHEGARDMRKNGRGIYSDTGAQEDDYVIYQHGTSGLFYVDRVGRGGTAVKAVGKPASSLRGAVAEVRKEALRRGYTSGIIFEMRAGEDDLRQIGQVKRGSGMDFEENSHGAPRKPIFELGDRVARIDDPDDTGTVGFIGTWQGEEYGGYQIKVDRDNGGPRHFQPENKLRLVVRDGAGYDRSDFGSGARDAATAGGRVHRTRATASHTDPDSRYHESRRIEPNARRESADEIAARELSLYIENEYSLVGAPNSQGKAIEKNLAAKIQKGTFDLALSEKAWMCLIESGAKKYAKEYSTGESDWSNIFNKPTRELVAHEFATTFYEEHQTQARAEPLSFDLEEYGTNMQHWHSSGSDPIYAVGSFAFAGKIHPDRDTIESALSELERNARNPHSSWKRADLRELKTLISQTRELLTKA